MKIEFDEKNLLAGVVGKANGLSRTVLERSTARALKALKGFRKLSDEGKADLEGYRTQTAQLM